MSDIETETATPAPSQEIIDGGVQTETNIYPAIRTFFLVLCVIVAIGIVLFLVYQNGKSIYESGL